MISYAGRTTALQTLGLWSIHLPQRHVQWPGAFACGLTRLYSVKAQSDKLNLQPPKRDGSRLYSKEEDAVLVSMRSQGVQFAQIRAALPHRGIDSLKSRWRVYLRNAVEPKCRYTKAPYSNSDLEKMRHLRASGLKWKQLPEEHFPDRKSNSLRIAFNKWLRYPLRAERQGYGYTSLYSVEERERLHHLKDELGLTWSEIQKQIPHRTIDLLRWQWTHKGGRSNKTLNPYSPHEDDTLYRMRVSSTP